MPPPGEVTALLQEFRHGNQDALDALLHRLYPDLRAIASRLHAKFRNAELLQPTSLAHEAIMRIFYGKSIVLQNRTHALALASRQMRFLLIDAVRRGGKCQETLNLDLPDPVHTGRDIALALDQALERLRAEDPRAADVVELTFFGGLTPEEIARQLGVSLRTVQRDWEFARAWLHDSLHTPD